MVSWFSSPAGQRGDVPKLIREMKAMSRQESEAFRNEVLERLREGDDQDGQEQAAAPADDSGKRQKQPVITDRSDLGEKTMPFFFIGKGEMSGKRPMFIALHGGGSAGGRAKSPHGWGVNTREWQVQVQMAAQVYPSGSLYFIPRMADDNDGRWYYSYCQDAYNTAVRQGILFHDVDPTGCT